MGWTEEGWGWEEPDPSLAWQVTSGHVREKDPPTAWSGAIGRVRRAAFQWPSWASPPATARVWQSRSGQVGCPAGPPAAWRALTVSTPSRRGTWTPSRYPVLGGPVGGLSLRARGGRAALPPCPFPLGVEGWRWPSPAVPCPPPRGALGPSDFPLALTDSARVCSLINQCQARHRQQGPHSSAAAQPHTSHCSRPIQMARKQPIQHIKEMRQK